MYYYFEYLKYWICTNIIHINHNIEFMWFLYKSMKIKFYMKFVQTSTNFSLGGTTRNPTTLPKSQES
jgi:hypothetical protein